MASGPVIMFEGDDYIGAPVNIAARLCDQAQPHELLATVEVAAARPGWIHAQGPARCTCGASLARWPLAPSPSPSEEHTSELQSLMRNSDADFCLQKKH